MVGRSKISAPTCVKVIVKTVKEKKLYFTIASPFNLVLELADHPNWLRMWHDVRLEIPKEKAPNADTSTLGARS